VGQSEAVVLIDGSTAWLAEQRASALRVE